MIGSGVALAFALLGGLIANIGHAYVNNMKYAISIEMGGALPDDARKAIFDNERLFDAVYIVAEAQRWTFERKWQLMKPQPKRVEADPLIIGRKNGSFYLIHTFDLTPLEKWLRAEFTGA